MNEIKIDIDKTITKLAGNEWGVELYTEKIANVYKNISEQKFKIVFPDNVDFITPSFIQGFFEELIDLIGIEGIEQNFEFYAKQILNLKQIILKILK